MIMEIQDEEHQVYDINYPNGYNTISILPEIFKVVQRGVSQGHCEKLPFKNKNIIKNEEQRIKNEEYRINKSNLKKKKKKKKQNQE